MNYRKSSHCLVSLVLITFLAEFPCYLSAPVPIARYAFSQCDCQEGRPFKDVAGDFPSLDLVSEEVVSCPEVNGTVPGRAGIVVNPGDTESFEALRSSLQNISMFRGTPVDGITLQILLKPRGFTAQFGSKSASLVEVRSSIDVNPSQLPKLLCGVSSIANPSVIKVFVASEVFGFETDFEFNYDVSDAEEDQQIFCGFSSTGPFACYNDDCKELDLSGFGYSPNPFSTDYSVLSVAASETAKRFTEIVPVDIYGIAVFGESLNTGEVTTVINQSPSNFQSVPISQSFTGFSGVEDQSSLSLEDFNIAYFNPGMLDEEIVIEILNLPPEGFGTVKESGSSIHAPHLVKDTSQLIFEPAENFYTSASCQTSLDFISLFSFQVFNNKSSEECVLDAVNASICITEVNDPPVLEPLAFVVDTTEKVRITLNISDVDDETQNGVPTNGGLDGGKIEFLDPSPQISYGLFFECNPDTSCGDNQINTASDIIDIVGTPCICYIQQPGALMGGDGEIVGIDYLKLVVNDTKGESTGAIDLEIQIRALLVTCTGEGSCTKTIPENTGGSAGDITLPGQSLLGLPISYMITRLPENGQLLVDSMPVVVNQKLGTNVVRYQPSSEYFNANEQGGFLDGIGQEICESSPCPESFVFKITTEDDGNSKLDNITIIVTSVNNENPIFTAPSIIPLQTNVPVSLGDINVFPGSDGDLYMQVLNISFSDGLQFRLATTSSVSTGVGTIADNIEFLAISSSCVVEQISDEFCKGSNLEISMKGYPTHLNDAMEALEIRATTSDPLPDAQLDISVLDGSASFNGKVNIDYTNTLSGLQETIIIASSTIAAVCALLIGARAYMKFKHRGNSPPTPKESNKSVDPLPPKRRQPVPPKTPRTKDASVVKVRGY